jgi:SpoVK/Ycf46/Vps4 family AAA+-type ATPase
VGIVLGKQGGVVGPGAEKAVILEVPIPDEHARKQHWLTGLAGMPCSDLDTVAASHRMTGGNIRRTAVLARSHAALAERKTVLPQDIRRAARAVHRSSLDALAARIDLDGLDDSLVVRDETGKELDALLARCRHREALRERVGPALRGQLNIGVRALFYGPSGTGKTLAARTLASRLGMDLYRVDLSSVVSKYIGETEKNLGQVFAVAEELDVMLLFDEGDSLFAQRTAVKTSNDRYANLETNYLLQRVETFEGIVVITTNAAEHIDSAFQRRMDMIVDFPSPDAAERLAIWKVHLPAKPELPPAFLDHVAARCVLTGGQIRNAVLHATLLALEAKRPVAIEDVEAAVVREYRRMGAMAPIDLERAAPEL